ncbi:MAG: SAM-dependent methyltransferase, partial [Treponema sp.]|nr:SAM-dependent methyltransferase [Treponema sp.]
MAWTIEKIGGGAFLPYVDMKDMMLSEFARRFGENLEDRVDYGDLIFVPGFDFKNLREEKSLDGEKTARYSADNIPFWCRCAMVEPFLVHFDSIGDAAQALKSVQRSWAPYTHTLFRRSALVQEKLPYINLKDRTFPFDIPQSPVGLYTLIDEHTILASAKTTSCIPAGKITWVEDHENPPSRAYLKIQESLVLAKHFFGVEL